VASSCTDSQHSGQHVTVHRQSAQRSACHGAQTVSTAVGMSRCTDAEENCMIPLHSKKLLIQHSGALSRSSGLRAVAAELCRSADTRPVYCGFLLASCSLDNRNTINCSDERPDSFFRTEICTCQDESVFLIYKFINRCAVYRAGTK
jgi:hypothetical protein